MSGRHIAILCVLVSVAATSLAAVPRDLQRVHSDCLSEVQGMSRHRSKPQDAKTAFLNCARSSLEGTTTVPLYTQAVDRCMVRIRATTPARTMISVLEIAISFKQCLNRSTKQFKKRAGSNGGSGTSGGGKKKASKPPGLPKVPKKTG